MDLESSDKTLDHLISERHRKVTTSLHLEESDNDHQSKFKTLFGLLKNFIGVKDIVSLRISLPAQLLEPIGNLEYWNYNDRPDYLLCIGDSDDPVERMLASIRWWFSKDLKHVKGKLIKPYNSILGEQFSCHWDVTSPKFDNGKFIDDPVSNLTGISKGEKKYRVTCINEQISHHPPVSAFYYLCEEKGVSAYGIDQIVAKFTGTSVKVGPGEQNKGIYINLAKRDNEEYLLAHPVASVQGWLKASLYIAVSESCIITCPKTKLKTILEYKEEKWLGKPKFAIEGKIFRYDPKNDDINKLKNINDDNVVAEITGSWRGQVHATRRGTNETRLLLDMEKLEAVPKQVKPLSQQGPLESRKVWQHVTSALFSKDYTKATKEKQIIEERQRQKAAERKSNKQEFESVLFKLPVIRGKPELKHAGIDALK
ncbi:oxysterol-binding protein-like protein OBPa [Glomus cerebriforme]|uniref:Oxysterol-binding protein-like protein OBPa n=1 Tax=Glomus cerebriforme TaxID=658196 RepID=A0A397SJ27_9GLOM|nr:oxysterol-binding protein-like protein OBPa [Glomus cerebriforme]